jgi:CRP-like cAMP-binding protein
MKKYFPIFKKTPLFRGVAERELEAMLKCLSPTSRIYEKNEYIYRQGEHVFAVGMVLEGNIHIVDEDFWGNRSIITDAGVGQLFGEAYACLPGEGLRINIQAAERSLILFFDIKRVLTVCTTACHFHTQLVQNILGEVARSNLLLTQKLSYMAKRNTREKLLAYLSDQWLVQGGPEFDIPFNRQQLADYLCVDRSAMSNELCKLRDEGVLHFERNHFVFQGKEN